MDRVLRQIRGGLPHRSVLLWKTDEQGLHLRELRIRSMKQGLGTETMLSILHEADLRGLPVRLEADSFDDYGTPDLFTLVCWYERLGFERQHIENDCWVSMTRSLREPIPVEEMRHNYEADRVNNLDRSEFKRWFDDAQTAEMRAIHGRR